MKMNLLASITALALLAPASQAANVDTIYYPDQGKVVIPNLKVGADTYYVILNKLGNTNDFRLNGPSVTKISGPLNFTPAAASDLIGSWTTPARAGAVVTMNANNTYSLSLAADPTDKDCPNGGSESGTYQYEPATGVFVAVATVDNNGQCGFSHSGEVDRVKKVGTDIYIFWKSEGVDIEMKLVKKP